MKSSYLVITSLLLIFQWSCKKYEKPILPQKVNDTLSYVQFAVNGELLNNINSSGLLESDSILNLKFYTTDLLKRVITLKVPFFKTAGRLVFKTNNKASHYFTYSDSKTTNCVQESFLDIQNTKTFAEFRYDEVNISKNNSYFISGTFNFNLINTCEKIVTENNSLAYKTKLNELTQEKDSLFNKYENIVKQNPNDTSSIFMIKMQLNTINNKITQHTSIGIKDTSYTVQTKDTILIKNGEFKNLKIY